MNKIVLTISFALLFQNTSYCFNGIIHQQIIKSSFKYLKKELFFYPSIQQWLKKDTQNKVEPLLIRSAVDIDYQPNLWIGAWYRTPFAGGKSEHIGMLTSLYHFLNITRPGIYWEYDGYAYRHTDGTGNDAYLGLPGMKIRGDLSPPLGKKQPPLYRSTFKGTDEDWQNLFFKDASTAKAVLPPSNLLAQVAYDDFLTSPRASEDKTEEWDGVLPVAVHYIFTKSYPYHYRRDELKDFPKALERLGVTLHLMQDLAMPHHSQGLTGYCHTDFEAVVDRLACVNENPSQSENFDSGYFVVDPTNEECQHLYNPNLVKQILNSNEVFGTKKPLDLSHRMFEVAKISARWRFGKFDPSGQKIQTIFPDQTKLSAKNCAEVLQNPVTHQQIQYQYNLAVAATVALLEKSAKDYAQEPTNSPLAR